MVVYEVTLLVEAAIAVAYRDWLQHHVTEMLGLPGFTGAELLQLQEPLEPGTVGWVVAYRLRDRGALDRYLAEHARRHRPLWPALPCQPAHPAGRLSAGLSAR